MNVSIFFLIAGIALLMCFLPSFLKFLRIYHFSKTLPGPTIRELVNAVKKSQVLPWLMTMRKTHGTAFRVWFGKHLFVFFTNPEDIRELLGSSTLLYKSPNYDIVSVWLGKGLLTNGGSDWHRRRKLLTPAFHFKILSEFKEPIDDLCNILVDKLRPKTNGEQFDIYPYITRFTLDAICETAMGIKMNALINFESDYFRAVQTICRILHRRSFSPLQRINIFFRYTALGKECAAAIKMLRDETNRVIQLRRQKLEESQIFSMADVKAIDEIGTKRRIAFLDMLLISQSENGELTDDEIREEVDTFLFEGHDTTASALGFAIYLLSNHPDVQQRAYEEAISFAREEKESMRYMEAIIKETLRLYPSVPFYSRQVNQETKIGKITIPPGVSVSTLAYMLHREENYFPEPNKFNPNRFLEGEQNMHPYAFVAFSAGPRNCIGQKFAMLEMKTTLAYLLRNFEFLPVDGFQPKLVPEFVLKSGNGIFVRLRSRE